MARGDQQKLAEYRSKRDLRRSGEPSGPTRKSRGKPRFVVQRHAASSLHFDFRLEIDDVLVSWAVPKGPSTDPRDKRLATRTDPLGRGLDRRLRGWAPGVGPRRWEPREFPLGRRALQACRLRGRRSERPGLRDRRPGRASVGVAARRAPSPGWVAPRHTVRPHPPRPTAARPLYDTTDPAQPSPHLR